MYHLPAADSALPPELTRTEYLRLLRAARHHGQHQLYLAVKLFAVTGLQCLVQIKPQVVQAEQKTAGWHTEA